jgi:hypothetical protein
MSKQRFKGKDISRTKVKNNIIKVFNTCEDRHMNDWYSEAYSWAADLTRCYMKYTPKLVGLHGTSKVVGILAATSPMKRWESNKMLVKQFLEYGECGHFAAVNKKCKAIYESGGTDTEILDILNGPKTRRFYMSINYHMTYDGVTIDRHALSIALGYRVSNNTFRGMTKRQYEFFEECYRYAARSLGITPMLLQSSTWQVFRENKSLFTKDKNR